MSKIDSSKYRELLANIKDDRVLIELLISYLCSKGAVDFREWVLFLESEIAHSDQYKNVTELKKRAA